MADRVGSAIGWLGRLGPVAKSCGGLLAAAGAVAAVFAAVGYNPIASTPPEPASALERVLAASDAIGSRNSVDPGIREIESHTRRSCEEASSAGPAQSAMKCWLVLSNIYVGADEYRRALGAIESAEDLDTRIADPYDARGALYYDLILFDVVASRRYHLVNPDKLEVSISPDATSSALARLATEEFQRGARLPFIGPNVVPATLEVTSQRVVAQTQNQVIAINNGAASLHLYPTDILAFLAFVHELDSNTADDKEAGKMLPVLERYAKAHSSEFPGDPFLNTSGR
jgi:hypothetical protein